PWRGDGPGPRGGQGGRGRDHRSGVEPRRRARARALVRRIADEPLRSIARLRRGVDRRRVALLPFRVMEYRNLGRTGLKVSSLCLGTMNFGPETSEPDSF